MRQLNCYNRNRFTLPSLPVSLTSLCACICLLSVVWLAGGPGFRDCRDGGGVLCGSSGGGGGSCGSPRPTLNLELICVLQGGERVCLVLRCWGGHLVCGSESRHLLY